jgi:hypothetical protein
LATVLADKDELGLPVEEQLARQRRRGRDLQSQLDLAQSKISAVEVRPPHEVPLDQFLRVTTG